MVACEPRKFGQRQEPPRLNNQPPNAHFAAGLVCVPTTAHAGRHLATDWRTAVTGHSLSAAAGTAADSDAATADSGAASGAPSGATASDATASDGQSLLTVAVHRAVPCRLSVRSYLYCKGRSPRSKAKSKRCSNSATPSTTWMVKGRRNRRLGWGWFEHLRRKLGAQWPGLSHWEG